jgi:hypothetical protein
MPQIELQNFLDHVNRGDLIQGGTEQHRFMHAAAQQALQIVAELNTGYHTPEQVRALLAQLTGHAVDDSVTVFPPFYSEFGKNLNLGKNVFINIGCRFQDTGGITIGDGTLIGHGSTLTTLNHSIDPDRRADMIPAPIVIGHNRLARRRSHGPPGSDHRWRRDRRRRSRRDQGRTRGRDRRRRPRHPYPNDRVHRHPELSDHATAGITSAGAPAFSPTTVRGTRIGHRQPPSAAGSAHRRSGKPPCPAGGG